MGLIRDLWRGDVPLVKIYWLFGVVAGFFFRIAFGYIEYQAAFFSTPLGGMFVLGLIIFVFAYFVFVSFAIWKSANNYKGLQRYAVLAKLAVILGMFMLIKALVEIFVLLSRF